MSRPRSLQPAYCLHKPSGMAIVRINGKQIWLGKHGTQVSRDKYAVVIGEWVAQARPRTSPASAARVDAKHNSTAIAIAELIEAYWTHCKGYYAPKPGRSSGELAAIRMALRWLNRLFGAIPVADFGPLKLITLREVMIAPSKAQERRKVADPVTGTTEVKLVEVDRPRWCRQFANRQTKRIVQMFKWGASRELIPAAIYQQISTVEGLRKGKTDAREGKPVRAAHEADVVRVLPFLPPPVRAMVELEAVSGMRPSEVRVMRGCDVDMTVNPWAYRPQWHKTEHHGESA